MVGGITMVIKRSLGEKVFDVLNILFMIGLMVATLYPFLYVAFASVSEVPKLTAHQGVLYRPLGFSLKAYAAVFADNKVLMGYANTIFYVVVGTALNLAMTVLGAYGLSKRNLYWGKIIMFVIIFTMFFGGGLIPTFLLVKGIGLYNSRMALIIPGLISTWNLIIMRTYFQSIPESLQESAKIDGANDFRILLRVILPLSGPVLAVITLFYGVGHWNSWFNAMVYLRDRKLYPLQLILREILIISESISTSGDTHELDKIGIAETIKYATIIVATVPILLVYPFLQKYFVKGVMIGAIKG